MYYRTVRHIGEAERMPYDYRRGWRVDLVAEQRRS